MMSTRCRLHNCRFEAHSIIASKWLDYISSADVTFSNNAFFDKPSARVGSVCHSHSRLLMAAEITSVLCITMPGLRSQWLVTPSQILDTKHGIFVCVDPRNVGLRRIVIETNPLFSNKRTGICSMKGYAMLRQLRNDATTALVDEPSCTLFDDCSAVKPKVTTPRKIKKRVGEPVVVALEVTIDGSMYKIDALQCKTARDKVFVASTSGNIHQVITMLRNSGMGGQLHKARDLTLPRGVWQRGARYVVHKQEVTKRYRLVSSLEAAQEFLGAEADGVDDGGEEADSEPAIV
jgi:hypothetical protein